MIGLLATSACTGPEQFDETGLKLRRSLQIQAQNLLPSVLAIHRFAVAAWRRGRSSRSGDSHQFRPRCHHENIRGKESDRASLDRSETFQCRQKLGGDYSHLAKRFAKAVLRFPPQLPIASSSGPSRWDTQW